MARPRKPTNVLELSGAFKKDPQRRKGRGNEPKPTGPLGNPPEYFLPAQVAVWNEIVAQIPDGMLTGLDRPILEVAVVQLEKFRTGRLNTMGLSCFISVLAKLGFTPSDRSKVQMPEKPKESQWAQYVR